MTPTLIDLFAGCGGLSMGLEQAGFKPVFVNELHPDAMETYRLNRIGSAVDRTENQVNDILELTQNPGKLEALSDRLRREHGEITLVAGGPPCQGYSGIGHRRSFSVTKEEIPSNHLYREMAKVVTAVAPKAFLFENVRGLLNSRWTPDGEKGEIWADVKKTFEEIEVEVEGSTEQYRIGHRLVLAKDYGVPQNRPRVLMLGIRSDVEVEFDLSREDRGLLPAGGIAPPDLVDLLSDLDDPDWQPGGSTPAYLTEPLTDIQRKLRSLPGGLVLGQNELVSDHEYSGHSDRVIEKFTYMLENGGEIPPEMQTKKFAQRVLPAVWGEKGPTITATSLADDYVHYARPRALTVREWARLQTFPDWYRFNGKRTTGGRRRAGDPSLGQWTRDLPKYTQIGNAVPVALANVVGAHLLDLLEAADAVERSGDLVASVG